MRRVLIAIGLLVSGGGVLSAAEAFAVLSGNGDIKLNGKALPAEGVPNWPLDVGDEVITGSGSAVITFSDGLRITLAQETRLVLEQCHECVALFYRGAFDYEKPAGSKAEICALGRPYRPAAGSRGSVDAESAEKIVVRVGSVEKLLTSGKCACNLGAPWSRTGMSTASKAAIAAGVAGTAATLGVVSSRGSRSGSENSTVTRPPASSPVP